MRDVRNRCGRRAIVLVGLLGVGLTSACSNMSYVPNASLRGDDVATLHDEDYAKAPQRFGAFRLMTPARGDSLDAVPQERLFVLKRAGKSYMAETMLFDHTGDPRAHFDKSFVAFGTDRENDTIGFTLRFVY